MTWSNILTPTSLLLCSLSWLALLPAGIGHSTKRNVFPQMVTFSLRFDLIISSLNIGLACSYQKACTAGFMVYGPQLRIVILIQMTFHLNKGQWTGSLKANGPPPPHPMHFDVSSLTICHLPMYQQSSGQGTAVRRHCTDWYEI